MRDFDYDIMQKKRIAASARHRVCGSKSRYCGLPSDHLTPAQIKKRSGPVMSYAMNLPMDWKTFKSMPLDLQQTYLNGLHSRFGVGATNISVDMFGLSKSSLTAYIKQKKLKPIGTKATRMSYEKHCAWEDWLHPSVEPGEKTEEPIEEPPEEPISVEEPVEEAAVPETPVLRVTAPTAPQSSLNQWLADYQERCEQRIKNTITMEPRKQQEFSVNHLAATFTGEFDPEKFLKWVSMLPMPEGDVRIHVEVATR